MSRFKKYLFALLVSTYVITVVGVPVYFHYCGGELERVNYVVKGDGCCGDESEDMSDCCKDENVILKANTDFTLKNISKPVLIKSYFSLFNVILPFKQVVPQMSGYHRVYCDTSPPDLQHMKVISKTVLRI